jgi:prepilin-type N-terminal cleavage/methylation domain-containing protein
MHDEAGFTLLEMLVATLLALVVAGGPLAFINFSANQQNTAASRSVALRQAEAGLGQLTRDLREAQLISSSAGVNTTPVALTSSAAAATATFYLPTAGSTAAGSQVVWTCTVGGTCTRKLGAGATAVEITGVTSVTFTGTSSSGSATTSNPSYVSINVQVQITSQLDTGRTHVARGVQNSIILQNGVALRNYS